MKNSSYEEHIISILKQNNIKFQREKTFSDLRKGKFRFDFFIPVENKSILIEVDGEYHFKPIRGRKVLLKQQEHDRRKNSYCLANDIPLYRIPYWEIKNIKTLEDIFKKEFLVIDKWHNDNLINS
jgi:very-short-patch-repair endonuclease